MLELNVRWSYVNMTSRVIDVWADLEDEDAIFDYLTKVCFVPLIVRYLL